MSEKIVSVSNLVKNYKSSVETLNILRGVNFSIERGTSVAITGQSGSGKSTLLNIIGGLDKLDSGVVVVAGLKINEMSESGLSSYRKTSVGFIFQFHHLLKDFTALENVMLPAYIAGVGKKQALEKARALLADVQLENRSGHLPSQLSGGERQRVAVARSMINDPAIILADEPTGNLDAKNTAAVADLLFKEAEKWGKTLLVVTHDLSVANRAQRRMSLANGMLENLENYETQNI
ncbi:lipoprotein-releasing system ATP-binding protein LolD [Spirochaetia bacterium]|nr:lipoprotein-releasing system ATP-binding protein LolD [Spirochaetia bacterium]